MEANISIAGSYVFTHLCLSDVKKQTSSSRFLDKSRYNTVTMNLFSYLSYKYNLLFEIAM